MIIQLDRVHRATRYEDGWTVEKRHDGEWSELGRWKGGRRSLYHFMESNGIVPDRVAESVLARIPESQGFKER